MSDPDPIVKEWVGQHDELEIDRGSVKHDGEVIVESITYGPLVVSCSGEMAVQGEAVEVQGEWLIIDGERHAWTDEGHVCYEGRVSVKPWQPGNPEIDGP